MSFFVVKPFEVLVARSGNSEDCTTFSSTLEDPGDVNHGQMLMSRTREIKLQHIFRKATSAAVSADNTHDLLSLLPYASVHEL